MTLPRLAFCHIHKTAGTTFRQLLRALYAPEQILGATGGVMKTFGKWANEISGQDILDRTTSQTRIIAGHFAGPAFLELNALSNEPYYLTSILRDPVRRSLSQIVYARELARRAYAEEAQRSEEVLRRLPGRKWLELSPQDYIRRLDEVRNGLGEPVTTPLYNYQARFLACQANAAPGAQSEDELLRQAIEIAGKFQHVGLSEDLARSLRLLAYQLAIPAFFSGDYAANTSISNRKGGDDILTSDDAARLIDPDLLTPLLRVDRALYEYAAERLEREERNAGLSGTAEDEVRLLDHNAASAGPLTEAAHISDGAARYGLEDAIIGSGWLPPTRREDGKDGRWTRRGTTAMIHLRLPDGWQEIEIAFQARFIHPTDIEAASFNLNGEPANPTIEAKFKSADLLIRSLERTRDRRLSLALTLPPSAGAEKEEKGIFLRSIEIRRR